MTQQTDGLVDSPNRRRRDLVARAKAMVPPLLILLGGLLAAWGSYGPWGTCSHEPCEADGGLPYLVTRYGFDFGTGVATALVGLALVLIGITAAWLGPSSAVRRVAAALALTEFILVGVHVARVHVFADYRVYGPEVGLIAVIAGAAVSMAGAALLRPSKRRGGAT